MPARFHVTHQVDEDNKRILFKISGHVDSDALIKKWQETYASIAEPWTYDRLFDYRRAEGLVDFDVVVRYAAWWHELVGDRHYESKVAVIVNNPLDLARVHVVANLFPMDRRESFTCIDDALNWLNGEELVQRSKAS